MRTYLPVYFFPLIASLRVMHNDMLCCLAWISINIQGYIPQYFPSGQEAIQANLFYADLSEDCAYCFKQRYIDLRDLITGIFIYQALSVFQYYYNICSSLFLSAVYNCLIQRIFLQGSAGLYLAAVIVNARYLLDWFRNALFQLLLLILQRGPILVVIISLTGLRAVTNPVIGFLDGSPSD